MVAKELTFDHVVIGAGSAGCPVARRLVDAGRSVAIVEAGGSDDHIDISTPSRMFNLWDSPFDWSYRTVPQAHANGTVVEWPRGKVFGGSSSLYGLVYARGTASDYDNWAYNGCPGWSWNDVLPYFIKSEDYEGGASEFHGVGGPLPVTHAPHPNPLSLTFLKAAEEYGMALTKDSNGPEILGAGTGSVNIKDGRRWSAWTSFVEPIVGNPQLTVLDQAQALRLLIEDGRCTGVFVRREGEIVLVRSRGDLVLSAGTIGSAQLLQLSGIGPAAELETLGIPVVKDLPGVGQNLHDHLLVPLVFEATHELEPPRANLTETHFFADSEPGRISPDLQPIFVPASLGVRGRSVPEQAFTVLAGVVRPLSRGSMRLVSADPDDHPELDPNYLSEPQDMAAMVRAVEICRNIVAQSAFDTDRGAEVSPGGAVGDELLDYIRDQILSYHHQVGTCKMGEDSASVVDPQLRVHGIANLRVADCSIIPTVPSANTHAAAVMIGERAADFILRS